MNEEPLRKVAHKILLEIKPKVLEYIKDKLKHIVKADNDDTADSIADDVPLGHLADFGGVSFTDLLGETASKSGNAFLVEIAVPSDSGMFEQLNTRAVAYAKAHSAELITQLEDTTRDEIRDIIAGGLTDGLSFPELSDKLEQMYSFSEDRADLIARTEIANANNQGVLSGMKELKDQGVKILKAWNPDDEACDYCLDLGAQGFIPVDEEFDGGDDYDDTDAPPLHPNCRCNLISEIQEDKDAYDAE